MNVSRETLLGQIPIRCLPYYFLFFIRLLCLFSHLNDEIDGKCSVATYNWNLGSVTADTVYTLNNFKSTVGLSGKNIVAVGIVFVAGSADYDYGASVIYRDIGGFARIKIAKTQSNTTACLYIIYTD